MTTAKTDTSRTAYLVLGMHRSGTSAATQVLALAGADLPRNVMAGDEHNQKGYFEPWKIALFNDRRLHAGGGSWDDIFSFPYLPLPDDDEALWVGHAEMLFRDEFGAARHPLLKDPRVSVLLPFWRKALDGLDVGARCVIPVRHPLAVAGSLARRDGFPVEKSLVLWSAYMLASEAYTRDLPRAFVGYDALLADWRAEVARMEDALGAPLPRLTAKAGKAIDGFLSPDLRHNAGDKALTGRDWPRVIAAQVYDWCAAAARGLSPDPAPLADARARLAKKREEMGVFVRPVTRDLDLARIDLERLRDERGQVEALVDSILGAR